MNSLAQSDEYVIESFQDEYNELTDFESLGEIMEGNPLFEMEYDLEFQFPLYGEYYNKLIYTTDAWGYVLEEQDLSLRMMDFTRGYAWDLWDFSMNPPSDIRFAHISVNNMQAFVIQYTKMGFFADPVEDKGFDPSMNFQLWFFENGVLEVHFGKMLMDDTPIYHPGKGFYCYTSSGGIDSTEICGPHVGISNPYVEEDLIALSGMYNNYEVVGDPHSVMNTMPPEGWIIRFKPRSVSIFEPDYHIREFAIHPNPANLFIRIPKPASDVIIYDYSGKIMYEGIPYDCRVNVSTFPSGLYFINIASGDSISTGKFFKL